MQFLLARTNFYETGA